MLKLLWPILLWVFVGVCMIWAVKRYMRPRKPITLDRFCYLAAERVLQRYPELRLLRVGDSFIEVDAGSGPCTIHLDNAHAAACSKPGSWKRQIDLAIQSSLEAGNMCGSREYEEIRDRILPILKPMRFVEASPRLLGGHLSLHWEPLGNDLAICYQIGNPCSPSYIGVEQLRDWDISPEELRDRAVRNLSIRTDWSQLRHPKDEANPALWAALEIHDGLDAARILLPELYEHLSKILGGSFVVAIPHRDALFAFNRSHKLVEMLKELFIRDRLDPSLRLADRFFLVSDQGITEYAEID